MARVRLSHWVLVGASALVGCRASHADPGSGLKPPAGWKSLPSLAAAARDAAKQGGLTVDGVEAWGDPARGCYAAWLAVSGLSGTPAKLADELVNGMEAEPALAGIKVTEVAKPVAGSLGGALVIEFEKPPYSGALSAALGAEQVTITTCFHNEREPIACGQACKQLLGSKP